MKKDSDFKPKHPEPEFKGPWWSHPYMLYIWLTVLLFGFLCFMAWFAWTHGWIPNRGIPAS
ncbi:MAG: hypothetical protein H7222_10720 [Methylotenera sp.]|nr:hypothetical protein [Oligoflexia bacterium]